MSTQTGSPAETLDRFAAELERALYYTGGTHDLDDLKAAAEAGEIQVWPGINSVMLTKIVDSPRKRELVFFLAAGQMAEIKRLYHVVIDYGRDQGCERAVFVGRKGWDRSFLTKDEGWRPTHMVFSKELTNGEGRDSAHRSGDRRSVKSLRA